MAHPQLLKAPWEPKRVSEINLVNYSTNVLIIIIDDMFSTIIIDLFYQRVLVNQIREG